MKITSQDQAAIDAARIEAMNKLSNERSFSEEDNKFTKITLLFLDTLKSINWSKGPWFWVLILNAGVIRNLIEEGIKIIKG